MLPRTNHASGDPIPKFLVFFDNIEECVRVAEHLRSRLHPGERERIHWFHTQMSEQFYEDDLDAFTALKLYGLCSTDSFI